MIPGLIPCAEIKKKRLKVRSRGGEGMTRYNIESEGKAALVFIVLVR